MISFQWARYKSVTVIWRWRKHVLHIYKVPGCHFLCVYLHVVIFVGCGLACHLDNVLPYQRLLVLGAHFRLNNYFPYCTHLCLHLAQMS